MQTLTQPSQPLEDLNNVTLLPSTPCLSLQRYHVDYPSFITIYNIIHQHQENESTNFHYLSQHVKASKLISTLIC